MKYFTNSQEYYKDKISIKEDIINQDISKYQNQLAKEGLKVLKDSAEQVHML